MALPILTESTACQGRTWVSSRRAYSGGSGTVAMQWFTPSAYALSKALKAEGAASRERWAARWRPMMRAWMSAASRPGPSSSASVPSTWRRVSSIWKRRSRQWTKPCARAPSRSLAASMWRTPSASVRTRTGAERPGKAMSAPAALPGAAASAGMPSVRTRRMIFARMRSPSLRTPASGASVTHLCESERGDQASFGIDARILPFYPPAAPHRGPGALDQDGLEPRRAPLRSRAERCLPALASWRGHRPAQETRCPTVAKRLMSVPISATRSCAAVVLTPGIVTTWSTAARYGARAAPIAASRSAIVACSVSTTRRCSVARGDDAAGGVRAAPRAARPLRAQPWVGQGDQAVGIGLARHQGGEDCPPTDGEQRAEHRGELHVGALQHLLDALTVGGHLPPELLARPRQFAQRREAVVASREQEDALGSNKGRARRCHPRCAPLFGFS